MPPKDNGCYALVMCLCARYCMHLIFVCSGRGAAMCGTAAAACPMFVWQAINNTHTQQKSICFCHWRSQRHAFHSCYSVCKCHVHCHITFPLTFVPLFFSFCFCECVFLLLFSIHLLCVIVVPPAQFNYRIQIIRNIWRNTLRIDHHISLNPIFWTEYSNHISFKLHSGVPASL